MAYRTLVIVLAIALVLSACAGATQESDSGSGTDSQTSDDGQSGGQDGNPSADSGSGSPSDEPTGTDGTGSGNGSNDSDGSGQPFGSGSALGGPATSDGSAADWFPTSERCQVEGNETIVVPGGTLISVEVFDVGSGTKVQSLGEVVDDLAELYGDLADLQAWAERMRDEITKVDNLEGGLAASVEIGTTPELHTDRYRTAIAKLGSANSDDNLYGIDVQGPFPTQPAEDLLAKAKSGQLTEDDKAAAKKVMATGLLWLIPVIGLTVAPEEAASAADETWVESLRSRSLANLSFICGYLFPMSDWDGLVAFWQSYSHPAFATFNESVGRIQARGDLHSLVIESMRGSSEPHPFVTSDVGTLLATKLPQVLAYGVTMAGVGTLGEQGYPAIYLTVKDGGKAMFDLSFRHYELPSLPVAPTLPTSPEG